MYRLDCKIYINDLIFNFCNSVNIKSSMDEITDEAKVVLPRKLKFEGKDIAKNNGLIKRGDKIAIKLNYDDYKTNRFFGFVDYVTPDRPIEVTAQDHTWLLKQFTFSYFKRSASLEDIINKIIEEYQKSDTYKKYNIDFVLKTDSTITNLGDFKLKNVTGAQALDLLRRKYGLVSYVRGYDFDNPELVTGYTFEEEIVQTKRINFDSQVPEQDLTYQNEDDINYKIKCISIDKDNKKIESVKGSADGQQRTFLYYNQSQDQLDRLAEERLKNYKFTGLTGTFKTFLHPFVRHSDYVCVDNVSLNEYNGIYGVRSVETIFNTSEGGKQVIELDRKILEAECSDPNTITIKGLLRKEIII